MSIIHALRLLRKNGQQRKPRPFVLLQFERLEERVCLDDNSAGANGVLARDLMAPGGVTLTGAGVNIGQVEMGRPGKPNAPINDPVPRLAHRDVVPAAVYLGTNPATGGEMAGTRIQTDHAERVAGVMIANGATNKGVAPRANLSASAFVLSEPTLLTNQVALLSMQRIASVAGMTAINLSWGAPFLPGAIADGNSLLSQGLDWLETQYPNVLFVKAGNQGAGGGVVPSDAFDGLVVGFTTPNPDNGMGVFNQVSPDNLDAENRFLRAGLTGAANERRFIDLVAPGITSATKIITTP